MSSIQSTKIASGQKAMADAMRMTKPKAKAMGTTMNRMTGSS